MKKNVFIGVLLAACIGLFIQSMVLRTKIAESQNIAKENAELAGLDSARIDVAEKKAIEMARMVEEARIRLRECARKK